jgi:hypothetical protein
MVENDKPAASAGGADTEAEILEAINAFESILDAMPNDRSSLETLAHAYAHIGDEVKSREYLIRLGHVIVEERDLPSAGNLLEQLQILTPDSDVTMLTGRLELLLSGDGPAAGATDAAPGAAPETLSLDRPTVAPPAYKPKLEFSISDELVVAWNLVEAELMTMDEYSSVAHDLAEMASENALMTVSVFHALEARSSNQLERYLARVSTDSSAPLIALDCYDVPLEVGALLPEDFMVRHGVMVFSLMGKEALVVMMNPYNKECLSEVSKMIGRPCHPFMAIPASFDLILSQLRTMMAAAATEAIQKEIAAEG